MTLTFDFHHRRKSPLKLVTKAGRLMFYGRFTFVWQQLGGWGVCCSHSQLRKTTGFLISYYSSLVKGETWECGRQMSLSHASYAQRLWSEYLSNHVKIEIIWNVYTSCPVEPLDKNVQSLDKKNWWTCDRNVMDRLLWKIHTQFGHPETFRMCSLCLFCTNTQFTNCSDVTCCQLPICAPTVAMENILGCGIFFFRSCV